MDNSAETCTYTGFDDGLITSHEEFKKRNL